MYNGIGLPTPRGSGTSGYVQRNLAHVKKTRQMKPDILGKATSHEERQPNVDILIHKKKRDIEAKCLKLRQELEDEGWAYDRIEDEVNDYRRRKLDALLPKKRVSPEPSQDKQEIDPEHNDSHKSRHKSVHSKERHREHSDRFRSKLRKSSSPSSSKPSMNPIKVRSEQDSK